MADNKTTDILVRLRTAEPDEPCLVDMIKMEDAALEIERLRGLLREVYRVAIMPQAMMSKVWDATNV